MMRPRVRETFLVLRGVRSTQYNTYSFGYKLNKRTIIQLEYVKLQVKEIFRFSFNNLSKDKVLDNYKIYGEEANKEDLFTTL